MSHHLEELARHALLAKMHSDEVELQASEHSGKLTTDEHRMDRHTGSLYRTIKQHYSTTLGTENKALRYPEMGTAVGHRGLPNDIRGHGSHYARSTAAGTRDQAPAMLGLSDRREGELSERQDNVLGSKPGTSTTHVHHKFTAQTKLQSKPLMWSSHTDYRIHK